MLISSVPIPQAIQHNHHHIAAFAGSCLTDVLEHWLDRTTPQPKWTDITRALRSSAIGRGDIAGHIETIIKLKVRRNQLTEQYDSL